MANWATKLTQEYWGDTDKVRIFGVIIYTDSNPNIIKALRDDDYWRALEEVSGTKWVIFSIKPVKGKTESPLPPPGVLYHLVPVWKEPKENRELLKEFGLSSTEDLPVLIVFTQDNEENLLKTKLKLDDSSPEAAYQSLKNNIALVTSALENVAPENWQYAQGAFRAAKMRLDEQHQWEMFRKGACLLTWIKDLIL